ncbi:MAG: hypothetical protein MNPFHGCM_02696 [Gemmatimonadaceae bacterium]|nr:hypothetical protein [Gemmatimonadaceae bacterium]
MGVEELIVDLASPCLIDGAVLLEGLRTGALESTCGERRFAVGRLLLHAFGVGCNAPKDSCALKLARMIADGRIEAMEASAGELVGVLRWVGSQSLGALEVEQVAIVLAGRARLWSTDPAIVRAMSELGLDEYLVGDASSPHGGRKGEAL